MMEPRVEVTMLLGQYAGDSLRLPRSEAENLVMTGQAMFRADAPAVETPGNPDLSAMKRSELAALAEARGVEVERADGEGAPLKADYIRALGG